MNIDLKRPIRLARAGAWRTYLGGKLIEQLHGNMDAEDTNFPEEWIMSTVTARNSGREHIIEGISFIDGTDITLKQLIEEYTEECLGKAHAEKYGATPGVLVKLLDAAERLTIQVHPTRSQAKKLFGSEFGKTECWHIVAGREINGEKPCIYFGFKEGITREMWKDIFDRQDIPAMLDCLHRFEVQPGDTFLIEGGIPHAIGAGCFLVEIQEPTDYTIRTERTTPSGREVSDFMCHQGLGFDKMFDCFDYTGYSKDETAKRWRIRPNDDTLIDYDNTEMFRLYEMNISGEKTVSSENTFSGIYILEGEGTIDGQNVKKGTQFFIPSICRDFEISGNMRVIRYFGPKV
ncbi:MAG: mannose-6-phosphate isomerase [Ruminococcaceae bacterium]|nr:mannose-6-phosphate isomerase [Oscillospiraceae bacterium]